MPIRRLRRRLGSLLLAAALVVPVAAAVAPSGTSSATSYGGVARAPAAMPADQANPDNPLAGRTWGVYKGNAEPSWRPFEAARGETKEALRTIALAPKAKFFGSWIPDGQIARKVRDYIASATAKDPGALVQLTLYRIQPWQGEACRRKPTLDEKASYRRFVRRFAGAIGDTHAAVVVQPDGPFARCGAVYRTMLRYAVRQLEAQPNTSAYLEMGSADWFRDDITDAVRVLLESGIELARGFALDTSHFDSVARQVRFGSRIVSALADAGVSDAHFVVDTSDNGRPFTGEWFHQTYGATTPLATSQACRSRAERRCVTLGIPPTTRVASPAWGLGEEVRTLAAEHVDGYLWISRPWLHEQSGPFVLERALDLVSSWPYAGG